jgi:precorrin-6B methylase 2
VAPAERPPTSNVFLTDTPYEFEVGSSDGDATRADAASREGWPDEDVSRLHRLMMAYVSSKALFSALELDVFNALSKEPVTAEELGAKIGLEGRPARNLLLALHGERLVRLEDGRYHLEPVASRYLVSSSPTYLGALIEHQDRHFTRFTKLTEALRNNRAVREGDNYDPDAFGGPESFIELTRAASHLMAAGVVAAADLTHHNRVVDLGCASGAYTMALAKANPNVRFTAVDNPTVCAITSDVVDQAGLAGRITVRPADIFKDTFPDCDAAFISNAIEGFDREHAQALVSHIYDWLPAGGELFVHSHMWERATSPFPFIIGLILVCNNTAGGEAYGEAVNREWLETAGFEVREVTPVSPISTLVRAVK